MVCILFSVIADSRCFYLGTNVGCEWQWRSGLLRVQVCRLNARRVVAPLLVQSFTLCCRPGKRLTLPHMRPCKRRNKRRAQREVVDSDTSSGAAMVRFFVVMCPRSKLAHVQSPKRDEFLFWTVHARLACIAAAHSQSFTTDANMSSLDVCVTVCAELITYRCAVQSQGHMFRSRASQARTLLLRATTKQTAAGANLI